MNKYLSKGVLLAGICLSACTEPNPPTVLAEPDREFMKMISYSNYAAIRSGEVAEKNGDSMVRWYGKMMQMDHALAQSELKNIALKKNYGLPETPDSMHMVLIRQIDTLTGRGFNITYLNMQLTDHTNATYILQDELKKGRDAELKNYAQKYLDKVNQHKHQADSLYKLL